MSKIRFSLVGIDTWFIRDRDLGRVWDWDWDLGSEISEKSPEISENIARDRDFPYIISEKLPRFGRGWYFSCIAAWISTRWLYFYRENSGKNGRDLGIRDQNVIPVSIYVTEMDMSGWEPALWTLMSQDRVMWLLSKKNIAIFGYKQWLLSLDMKTKIVQHVSRINLSNFKGAGTLRWILRFLSGAR